MARLTLPKQNLQKAVLPTTGEVPKAKGPGAKSPEPKMKMPRMEKGKGIGAALRGAALSEE
jgi:hypothetical protein